MSLFENPSVSPSRLRGVYRFLLRAPDQREERERLGRLLMPEPMLGGSGRATFDRTILEGCGMKLFEEVEEDGKTYVALHSGLPPETRDQERGEERLTDLFCDLLLDSENERNDELAHAIAWLLTRNPLDAAGEWDTARRALNQSGCDRVTGLSNAGRYRQLRYWVSFLGFAWQHEMDEQIILVPDPTTLLRRSVERLFQEPGEWRSLPGVLRRLAEAFPVFEGGQYRDRIEELDGQREAQHLSRATAQAFLRLRDEGSIDLEERSDDPGMRIFPGSDGSQRFSHACWTP